MARKNDRFFLPSRCKGKPFFFTSKFSYCFFINSPVSLSLTYPFLYETPAFLNKRKIPKNTTKLNDGFSGHAIENKELFKVEFLSTTIILILILNDYEQESFYNFRNGCADGRVVV